VISQAVKFAKKIGNKLGFGKDKKGNKDGEKDAKLLTAEQAVSEIQKRLNSERSKSNYWKR
jgi:hypothetical protein